MYDDDLERERACVGSSVLLLWCDVLSFLDQADGGWPWTGVLLVDGRPSMEGAGVGAASVL